MKYKVFVDGQEGTTGLKINERLEVRSDIEVLKIDPDKRKDPAERSKLLNEADIAFLCLPDAAARESVSMVTNNTTRLIDASTAHRTQPEWVYGLPELSRGQRELIKSSRRVAVPGCHATGFNLALYPLVKEGIVPKDYPITCHSITGYSGGGKKLIELYETESENACNLESPRFYSLTLAHKHLPEMQKVTGLSYPPVFTPIVSNYYQGMSVSVPLVTRLLNKKPAARDIHEFLAAYYQGERFVKVMPYDCESCLDKGYLGATGCNNTNNIELYVFGHQEQVLILSRLDNLGKGASGAAIQNMNIMLGVDEGEGLE